MQKEVIIKHLGYVLLVNGFFLLIAGFISFYGNESSTIPLFFSSFICLIFGVFPLIFVEEGNFINFTEGTYIVVFGWLMTCVAGMLPYLMWGGEFSLANAWFESVSGFTTTGSTILNDIESLPKGILFWRSSTHWIGGIGIILFILLILPQNGQRISIYNIEISALSKLNFKLQSKKIIRVLAIVYVSLTLLETSILMYQGMSFFDAINHSFATIATGGFSTKNMSIASFNNLNIEITIMVFMILSGIHFGLIYGTIMFKKENIFKSNLVRAFLLVIVIGVVLTSLKLFFEGTYDLPDSLRYASFQVISLATTTGFATADTANWPFFVQMILIYFTIQCAMSGSTSGGLKFDRVYIVIKSIGKQIKLLKHPHGVFAVNIGKQKLEPRLEHQTLAFTILYLLIAFLTTLVLSTMDIDGMTAFSASITTLGNVGPGFGGVSSLGNFADIPDFGKFMLTFNMLMGRLELFNILALVMMKN